MGATDADIGQNARISYSMLEDGDGTFGIYEESGILFMNSRPVVMVE